MHVGTNDCVQSIDIENAGTRLATLIDRLFDAIPGVTIIASTLLPNGNANTQANAVIYNSQIPGVVQARQAAGKKIAYVDFSSSYFSLSDIGSDGTHPTEAGYLKMAEVWYQGIQAVDSQGWLSPPAAVSGVDDTVTTGAGNTCDKVPGNAIGPTQTQNGSGSDDGAYVHVGTQVSSFAGFNNPSTVNFNNSHPEGVFWADIDGDGIDDYVYVGSNSDYGLGVALSLGAGNMGPYLYFTFPNSCNRPGVQFADMTGDGRDDFCCIGPDGGVDCWQNTPGSDSRSPTWVSMGTVKASEGYPQAQVRLADIDGDGRADYVAFDAFATEIYGWRNGATSNVAPMYWYPMDGVFTNLPDGLPLDGFRFVDLNGDKKDDLIWVNANGQVTTWINRRGFKIGLEPAWVSHGVTHQGSSSPVNVTFGAFMGSGRADYALVSIKKGNVYIQRWENHDHGGTMVRGDGTFYCDMTGSGSDDYVFINSTGAITLFENGHNWGYWIPWGHIYYANRAREEIHLADFDGDGKCDILLVDKASGATTVIQNQYSGTFAFSNLGVVTGSATCTEGYGKDKHDKGVRWNDIDGDGRADFLCMSSDGTVHGYLNKGVGNMVDLGQIKKSEGKERVNLRFADINGDGKDDYLYVDMLDGAVTAWYNGGAKESSGSAYEWNWQGNVSSGGSSRGACVEFGELYGVGRADYIVVEPATNKAWTWFNVCPGGGVGPITPNLPSGAPPVPVIGSGSIGGNGGTATTGSSGGTTTTAEEDGSGYVTIDPTIYGGNPASVTVQCSPPCTYVMPPLTISSQTTFSFPPLTTTVEVGWLTSSGGSTSYTSVVETTVITIPAVTTSVISVFDVTVTDTETVFFLTPSVVPSPFNITDQNTISGTTHPSNTRTFYPPPWPGTTAPPTSSILPSDTSHDSHFPPITHTSGSPGPVCTSLTGCGSHCAGICSPCWISCPGPPSLNWWDSNDPEAPPGQNNNDDPDGPDDPDDPDEGDSCEADLSVDTGLCSNGNFPLYDPETALINCDYNSEDALDMMGSCQKEALNDPSSVQDAVDNAKNCDCGGSAATKRSVVPLAYEIKYTEDGHINQTAWREYRRVLEHENLFKPRADRRCASTTFPAVEAVGACVATYTCNFDDFPNVCANARSAILERGKTSVLTYNYQGTCRSAA